MCGITGFVGRGDEADLRRMTAALSHRGPDAEGLHCDPESAIYLGHRRLSVVDLETGDQPMWTADGELGVVFNGEIYNHRELREILEDRGHVFRSHHSDTEVLLHGYREWGETLVERLNGMWALALLDRGRRRLWLSRDRFGQKPLYWWHSGEVFAFASELQALAGHHAFVRSVDENAVRKYFAYGYVPAPASLYRGARKLAAGSHLVLDLPAGTTRLSRWWTFLLEPEPAAAATPEAVDRWTQTLGERLEDAVARRLVADVPVGVFLSGGVDSSSVAALARRRTKSGELFTFSIGFDDPRFDESGWAARVARHVGAEHHVQRFTAEDARRAIGPIVERLDEPLADPSLLPTHLLCGVARRQVTVALGGDGADELFAGYDPFRALRYATAYARVVPRPVHAAIRLLAARVPTTHGPLSFDFALRRTLSGLSHPSRLWNAVWMSPLAPAELAELLGEPVDPESVYSEAIEAWEAGGPDLSTVDRTLQFFTRLYLQDDILAKLDRASMMHGLEVRSPFLDVDLVDLVRRLPASVKLRGGATKWILKRAVAPWLPDAVLRRRKRGFGIPIGRWLAEGRAPFDDPPQNDFHARRLAEHRAGRADHRLYLYAQWLLGRFSGASR